MRRRRLVAVPAVVAAVGLVRTRAAMARWGATSEEVGRPLPGDDLVSGPDLKLTRAITIRARPEAVFPWLAQLGQGRGGFYSYDWLENRSGLDIHSADRVLPQHQRLEPGDRIPLAPGPPFYGFVVADVAAPSRLVLQMQIHPFTGRAIQPGKAPSLRATWAFSLIPTDGSATRLVSRSRVRLRLPTVAKCPYLLALEVVELVMERRMLLGIKERAERLGTQTPHPERMTT